MTTRFSAALLLALSILAAPGSSAAERDTVLFLSDLHMNVDGTYSWLVHHTGDLAAFLDEVNHRADVAEVVILGDMVDLWVSPAEGRPNTIADVLAASTNTEVVAALRRLCANPSLKVTYVVGNHDMLSFEPEGMQTLTAAFPGLRIESESPGMGAYTKDEVIWAEHGHRYTMFNAPDTWSRPGGHLPLGYFISRMVATRSARTKQVVTTPEVLDTFVKQSAGAAGPPAGSGVTGVFDDAFVIAVFDAVALWCEVWPWDRFVMNDTDGFYSDPRVLSISTTYEKIYGKWPARQDRVSQVVAVWDDVGHLAPAANLIFEMPEHLRGKYPFTPRIVIFGHTHEAAFQYHAGEPDTVYVNSGTWIDGKPMTWVEVEKGNDGGQRTYAVSLWFRGEDRPRQSTTLRVTPL